MNLVLTFEVKKPLETVFENLTDMQKFVSNHPVIDKIEPLSKNIFLVNETLKLGFIPVSFRYQFSLNMNLLEQTVEMNATVMKFTKIKMVFVVKSEGHSSQVTETILFKSTFPIKWNMSKIFKIQHITLFANMNL
jgi:carbon monoxide dehydrogenase subunit G